MGSVIGMTDEGGTVARYSYDPWGRVTDETAIGDEIALRNPLRYRAYYHDAETGLYYMPARYYDPATYRFLSADPAAPSAGDPGSLNAFAYCGDDPIGGSDPSGARMIEEAEAWSTYYQKFHQDRKAATQAAKQVYWICRGTPRKGTLKVIFFGGMAPGDEESDRWERIAYDVAANESGDVLVVCGYTQGDWEAALNGLGGIVDLQYIGHSTNDGTDLYLSDAGDGRFWPLDIDSLPTRNMITFGQITLWTCEGAVPGGVVYQFSRHFGMHTIGNKNLLIPMEAGICRPEWWHFNTGWVDVDLGV